MKKNSFFFLLSLCFAASSNNDPSPAPVLSSTARSECILMALNIARSTQAKYKLMGDLQEPSYIKFNREQCMDGLYSQTFLEFSWWNIQKDIFALLRPEENTMDDVKKRLVNGLISIIRMQRELAFEVMEPHQKTVRDEIGKYPENNPNYYVLLSNVVEKFNVSGKINQPTLFYCHPFSTELPAVTRIIVNLYKVFKFDIPTVPIHCYYNEAENLINDSRRKLSNVFKNFDNQSLETLIKCIHLTTRGNWYSPETEKLISLALKQSIQHQKEGRNRQTQEPKKVQPQKPKKSEKIQPQHQKFVPQEDELDPKNPILIAHVLRALDIADKNRLLNQHRGVSMIPDSTSDSLNPIIAHRVKFVSLVYIYVSLEFSWWEIQKDIFALLSPKKNIRMAARERLTIGLMAIVHKQLRKAVTTMKEFPTGCAIMEEHSQTLAQEMNSSSDPNPIIFSSLIRLLKTWTSTGLLSANDLFYYHLYSTEITAASEIIMLLTGIVEFNAPTYDDDYYSRALRLETESKISLLRDLKKIDSLNLGLFREFILKTTKKTWYSKETEDLISKFCKSGLDEEKIKAQELRKVQELLAQSQKFKLEETRRQEQEKNLLGCEEIPPRRKRTKHRQQKNTKAQDETNKTIETKPETIEEPFGDHSNIEDKERRARLKKEHEDQKNSHLEVDNEMENPKTETSSQRTLREVIEARNMLGLKVDDVGAYMVKNQQSFLYTAKLRKAQRFVCSHDPSIILNGEQFRTLCCLFGVMRGVVGDQDFLKLIQGLGCTKIRTTDGSKRTFTICGQIKSVHKAHSSETFDWPRARRLCLKAGFSPHSFCESE